MKKFVIFIVVTAIGIGWYRPIYGEEFDAKLKRFITIQDGKYAPEVSCEEAVKLGFTVNDYNRFADYVGQLNEKTAPALTLPENLFLCSFIEYDGDTMILTISLEKALRAGATAEGYFQTLEIIRANNALLENEEFFPKGEQDKKREKLNDHLTKYRREMLEFARENPDSCAVKKFFTPPLMHK